MIPFLSFGLVQSRRQISISSMSGLSEHRQRLTTFSPVVNADLEATVEISFFLCLHFVPDKLFRLVMFWSILNENEKNHFPFSP